MLILKNNVCIEEITHFVKLKVVKPAHALQEKNVQVYQIPYSSESIRFSIFKEKKVITLFTYKFQKDYLAVGPLLMLIYFGPRMH